MNPVIVLVGRPNVGKSTLFNRLTRSRDALVIDVPGATRDRQYGNGLLGSIPYIVVDTGGMGELDEEGIQGEAVRQSQQAIDEADVVIFVVDGQAGRTPVDEEIAASLRGLDKPVFLAVNKTDGLEPVGATSEFYSLGVGDPFMIAATQGRGVSLMMDHVLAHFPMAEFPPEKFNITTEDGNVAEPSLKEENIKLAVIGRPNVGKSTLINRMLGEDRVVVFDEPGTTRDSIAIPFERQEQKYTLIDTAGVRRKGKTMETLEKYSVIKTLQTIKEANVCCLVIDGKEGITEQDLKLLGFILEAGRGIVILVNKWDCLDDDEKIAARDEIDRRLTFCPFAEVKFISAKHGSGVGDIYALVEDAFCSAMQKLPTPRLTDLLLEAVEKHPPPMVNGRRAKMRYAHAGGHNPPVIVVHGKQTRSLPESYRRYLMNFYSEKLHLVGTPITLHFKDGENPFRGRKNKHHDRRGGGDHRRGSGRLHGRRRVE